MGNQVRTDAGRLAGNLGDVLVSIFKIFAKVLGAMIVVFAAVMLGSMIIGLFTLGSTSLVDVPWQNYIDAVNYTDIPLWIIGILFFLAAGIPFFFLFILGLKLLVNNLKSIGSIAKYTLLALWLIAVATLITLGIKQATETAFDAKAVQKEMLQLQPNDTLVIKFRYNDYYAKDVLNREDFQFTQDEANKELIYSNQIQLHILKTDETQPYIQIERQAEGKSLIEAKQRAEKIKYAYKIEGNQLILDNYLLTDISNKYRNQEVEIFLYLPEGTLFRPDNSVQEYDGSDDGFFNLHHSGDYLYRVGDSQVKCLDCPIDENEYDDVEGGVQDTTETTKVSINENGVRITNGTQTEVTKEVKGLEINEDGIIIKTK